MGSLLVDPESSLSASKYAIAVIKAREVVSLHERYAQSQKDEILARLMVKFDHLLAFLMEHFCSTPSVDEVRTVLNNFSTIDALDEDVLGKMKDEVVPIALMREIIRKHRVFVDHRVLSNWGEFVERYKDSIFYA